MSSFGRIPYSKSFHCFCFTNKYYGVTQCSLRSINNFMRMEPSVDAKWHRNKVIHKFPTNYVNQSPCPYVLKYPSALIRRLSREMSTYIEPRSTLSVSQVKKTLKSNGIPFSDGYTCLQLDCPVCSLSHSKKKNKAFVNKMTGYTVCFDCGYASHWDLMEKLLVSYVSQNSSLSEDLERVKEHCCTDIECTEKWNHVCEESVLLESLPDVERMEIFVKFSLPNIPVAALKQLKVRVNKSETLLFFPLFNAGGHVAGYKVFPMKGREETFPLVCSGGVIVISCARSGKLDSAVLVLSVRDALALVSQKITCNVVCLPHGEVTVPQDVLPALERYRKIVLWFGNSVNCWDGARNVARKLGENRCYFVRPTGTQPAPHEAIGTGADLRTFVNNAKPIWHKAITTFSSLRQDILAELQNIEKVQGVKWKRFSVLNRILKGHRRGEFTVLTGPTGCGKTTFMSEYSLDLATQGVTTLWGSFEIRNIRLARTMLQQLAGMPLDAHLEQFETWADAFERLPLYFMTFHGQQPVRVVMEAVEHAAYVHDIAHVVIDNVQFMMGLAEEAPKHTDRFWKQDAIVSAFRNFATRANCHVTLVMHPRKEQTLEPLTVQSIFGSAKASQEADNVLIIQDKRLSSVRGKKYLQVAKNRYSGDLGMMPLEFDKDSLSYSLRKKKLTENVDTADS